MNKRKLITASYNSSLNLVSRKAKTRIDSYIHFLLPLNYRTIDTLNYLLHCLPLFDLHDYRYMNTYILNLRVYHPLSEDKSLHTAV